MAYSNFTTIEQLTKELNIVPRYKTVFSDVKKIEPSEWLRTTLSFSDFVTTNNEKSKSESIVYPVLAEVVKLNDNKITIFSGSNLDADKERSLNGECDFIITENIGALTIESSILQIVEAKDHNIKTGIPQCAAQMLGAQIINEKNDAKIDCIYGCVTTGDDWQFMKLYNDKLCIDKKKYYINEIENILGVFQEIINYFEKSNNK
jgi:fructose-specific component phosphotransferase system IIB-like protein